MTTHLRRLERQSRAAQEDFDERFDTFDARLAALNRCGDFPLQATNQFHSLCRGAADQSFTNSTAPCEHGPLTATIMNSDRTSIQAGCASLLATASPTADRAHQVTVKLGDEEFSFDRRTVPDPPGALFTKDLSGLFQAWHESNTLTISGRGIPIKYWQEIYAKRKGIKNKAWDAIRVRIGNWKVRGMCPKFTYQKPEFGDV